jgi:adenylyltransferase/sulfurtransferase
MPVFICRSGTRSLTACAIASRAGLRTVAHLEGGLLAWAKEVNTDFVVTMA